MNYTIDRTTPAGAPYEVGRVYKTSGEPIGPCPICEASAVTTARITRKRRFVDCGGIEFTV